jgi:hypothetical protein
MGLENANLSPRQLSGPAATMGFVPIEYFSPRRTGSRGGVDAVGNLEMYHCEYDLEATSTIVRMSGARRRNKAADTFTLASIPGQY